MKVILSQDITSLGEEGEIKDVARGYARNYLIPKKMVMPYTREALSLLESRREQIEHRRDEKRTAAMDTKTRLESEPLIIEMPAGDRGRLFGSVTSATIADALAAQGIDVERRRIDIPEKTIKNVGTTYVRVRLYGDEEAELRVDVTAAGGTPQPSAPSTAQADETPVDGADGSENPPEADGTADAEDPADDAPAPSQPDAEIEQE